MKKLLIALFALAALSLRAAVTDLSGTWECLLDPGDEGINNYLPTWPFTGAQPMKLPGSLEESGIGIPNQLREHDMLSSSIKYVGLAWYRREVDIPAAQDGLAFELFLERVNWESMVWLDGRNFGKQDGLATPHRYDLGKLKAGKHVLVVRVNNDLIHNIGVQGHSYCKNMQKIWNGIIGRVELRARPLVSVSELRLFPNATGRMVRVELGIKNLERRRGALPIQADLLEYASGQVVQSLKGEVQLGGAAETKEITLALDKAPELWSEFSPHLYRLRVSVLDAQGKPLDAIEQRFGFRSIVREGNRLALNGRPLFLRGNADAFHFPLTGYPSAKVEDWRRIFRIYREHGLNHVRYHSCCPPDAAFQAADELGLIVQAEAGLWIDGWMGKYNAGREDMYTKGEPQGVGRGDAGLDAFVEAESKRITDAFGNSPSFAFFCIGNELGPSDFDVMAGIIGRVKERDPRRLYFCSTARKVMPVDDLMVTHAYPGIGWVRQHYENNCNWDYEDLYKKTAIPTIAHEIGQWPVYPDWNEIRKYTGTQKPRNLEYFRDQAKAKNLFAMNKELTAASGALNALIYKDEIEGFLRTPSCAGFQLLGMQDYSGQGEALIGWLDSFYDSKGVLAPATFRRYCAPTVPLLKLPRYVWKSGETLTAAALLHHYGEKPLADAKLSWSVTVAGEKKPARSGEFAPAPVAVGTVTNLGSVSLPLDFVTGARKCTLELSLAGTEMRNSWDFWVFPESPSAVPAAGVMITNRWDAGTKSALEAGARVLLLASGLGDPENANLAHWRPIYWSPSFLPTSQRCIGLILRAEHPALAGFPTDTHSDWQWMGLCGGARGFNLNDLPADYLPIAQPVSHFHFSDKLGTIFELAVGKGRVLVCGYSLGEDRAAKMPEVRQLKNSLLAYAASDRFAPRQQVTTAYLDRLFRGVEPVPVGEPVAGADALLNIICAGNQAEGGDDQWRREIDKVNAKPGVSYTVDLTGTWRDGKGIYWHGKTIDLTVTVPAGTVARAVYLHFRDPETYGREGRLTVEGRKYRIGKQAEPGLWAALPLQAEDTRDGVISVVTEVTNGQNLMIDRVVVAP